VTIDEIRALHASRPFQPFTIHTVEGRSFEVTHPMCVAFAPSGRVIAIAMPDDSFVELRLASLARLTPADAA